MLACAPLAALEVGLSSTIHKNGDATCCARVIRDVHRDDNNWGATLPVEGVLVTACAIAVPKFGDHGKDPHDIPRMRRVLLIPEFEVVAHDAIGC